MSELLRALRRGGTIVPNAGQFYKRWFASTGVLLIKAQGSIAADTTAIVFRLGDLLFAYLFYQSRLIPGGCPSGESPALWSTSPFRC